MLNQTGEAIFPATLRGKFTGDGVARRSGPRLRPCHQLFVRHQRLTRA